MMSQQALKIAATGLAVLSSLAEAAATGKNAELSALHMKAAELPANVVQTLGAASPDDSITLSVSLKHRNLDHLEPMLHSVSDPSNPDHGKYLSSSQIASLFGPSESSAAAVQSWLANAGIQADEEALPKRTEPEGAGSGPVISFTTTVGAANALLGADFAWYDVQGSRKLRTHDYTIPGHLAEHIDLVTPTTYFGPFRRELPYNVPFLIGDANSPGASGVAEAAVAAAVKEGHVSTQDESAALENCAKYITPRCLEEAYNFGGYEPDAAETGSTAGFASFLNQTAVPEDLKAYLALFDRPENTFETVSVDGGEQVQRAKGEDDPDAPHGEANLDVQLLAAVTRTLPITQYVTEGKPPLVPNLRQKDEASNTNEPWLEYFEFLLSRPNVGDGDRAETVPWVVAHSYGDDEQTVPLEYAARTCVLAGMLGLRGVSVLVASGDSGVGAPCRANDGSERRQFTPIFPATCPYVTAVGGTQAWGEPPLHGDDECERQRDREPEEGAGNRKREEGEVAWVGSSGGFSFYFKRPSYQQNAVQAYLDGTEKCSDGIDPLAREYYADNGFVNFGGRGFPDVAAHSVDPGYVIITNGNVRISGGTSAATPVFAGVVALLNDARFRAGLPSMGFLNPWLYGGGYRALRDVTHGRAEGCQGVDIQTGKKVPGAGVIPGASWNATRGWDPVTGWGLLDFEAMRKLVVGD